MTVLLKATGIKKSFPIYRGVFRRQVGAFEALKGIDLTLSSKEILGVVGESGSGKSTLARVLLRLLEPSSGSIEFLGEDFLSLKRAPLKKMRQHLQMVFQDPYASLNPRKTVESSIGEVLSYYEKVQSPKERQEQVVHILEQVGCSSEILFRYPHQLSGGQQQRVAIGRAISLNPQVLVLDEALSALDVSVQSQILNLLLKLREEKRLSYLFISHDLRVVKQFCDRVIVLSEGSMVETGDVNKIFENPKHPYTQKLLSSIPRTEPRK